MVDTAINMAYLDHFRLTGHLQATKTVADSQGFVTLPGQFQTVNLTADSLTVTVIVTVTVKQTVNTNAYSSISMQRYLGFSIRRN